MKVLVTGGSGMLGSRIVRQLLAVGASVRVAYRPGDSLRALEGAAVEHCPADLLDAAALARAVDGVEAVFHTAALVTFDPRLYDVQMRVNVGGTRALLDAARAAGVRRFVHTSTVNTLGVPPEGTIGDESTPSDWGRWHVGYMDSKLASERLVVDAARSGLDTVVVLPGTMFGPGDVNFNGGAYIRTASYGLLRVALPGGVTAAHVDDVAAGHLLALDRGRTGERYILGGQRAPYLDLFRAVARAVGRSEPRIVVPARLLRGIGRGASLVRDRLGLPLPLTEGVLVAACAGCYYSSAKAERELGWTHRPYEDGIRDAVRWYREAGLI